MVEGGYGGMGALVLVGGGAHRKNGMMDGWMDGWMDPHSRLMWCPTDATLDKGRDGDG